MELISYEPASRQRRHGKAHLLFGPERRGFGLVRWLVLAMLAVAGAMSAPAVAAPSTSPDQAAAASAKDRWLAAASRVDVAPPRRSGEADASVSSRSDLTAPCPPPAFAGTPGAVPLPALSASTRTASPWARRIRAPPAV